MAKCISCGAEKQPEEFQLTKDKWTRKKVCRVCVGERLEIDDGTINIILKRQREIADSLCITPVDTYEKYIKVVGRYQGLQEALDIHFELQQANDEDK